VDINPYVRCIRWKGSGTWYSFTKTPCYHPDHNRLHDRCHWDYNEDAVMTQARSLRASGWIATLNEVHLFFFFLFLGGGRTTRFGVQWASAFSTTSRKPSYRRHKERFLYEPPVGFTGVLVCLVATSKNPLSLTSGNTKIAHTQDAASEQPGCTSELA
jgi:hypothetical protein